MSRRIARALPRTEQLTASTRRVLIGALAVLALVVAVVVVNAATGVGGTGAAEPIRAWGPATAYILVGAIVGLRARRIRAKRAAWTIFAIGILLYGVAMILWSAWLSWLPAPPRPSLSDALWLAFYPCSYAAIVGLTSFRGQRRPPAGVWLDGIVAGSGLAALGAAVVLSPALTTTPGSGWAVATELAYPIGDLLLAGLVLGVVAVRGWRLDRGWATLGFGFLLMAIADCLYTLQVSGGANEVTAFTNILYVVAFAAFALSSWQSPPTRPEPKVASWSVLLVPTGFTIAALGLLIYDRDHRINALAFGLATLTLVAAIGRMVCAFRDARGLFEARRLAATDDLTSLPNRRQFMGLTEKAIAETEIAGGALAVLMLDLDNFKELNDTLGHHAGDTLLRMIGPRLEHALRHTHVVARLGGDEFAVLLYPAPAECEVALIAERVLHALREPFHVHGLALRVTGSLGIASYPAHARDADELMRHADIAMYQAKTARNGYDFYAHERDTNSRERLALAAELASALEHGGIEVHFQPKGDIRSRRIVGVEALVRWRRADGRLMPPAEFVPAAEHAGLARALTGKVLELALAQIRAWRDAGHELNVAVNTTVADLLDGAFPEQVAVELARHGLPANALILEITETSVLADPDRIGAGLDRLVELGIELSLDDFGTGYSSLAHLKSMPVSEIKIDRAFVARMCSDATDSAIVYAMIQLARKLGIRVVAEGVEDRRTWEELQALDCDLIQGYLLSRPMPAPDLEPQLEAQREVNSQRCADPATPLTGDLALPRA